jgi:hypothetical protein
MQRVDAGGFQLEFADMAVQDCEALFAQHDAIRKAQAVDIATAPSCELRLAGPRRPRSLRRRLGGPLCPYWNANTCNASPLHFSH